jgi:hypothetical protein
MLMPQRELVVCHDADRRTRLITLSALLLLGGLEINCLTMPVRILKLLLSVFSEHNKIFLFAHSIIICIVILSFYSKAMFKADFQ